MVQVSNDEGKLKDLNPWLFVLEDTSQNLTFEQICSQETQSKFVPYTLFKKQTPKLARNKVYWAKLSLHNASNRSHWILYAGKGSRLELYYPDANNKYLKKINGRLVPASKRDISKHIVEFKYKFNVVLLPHQNTVIYIKLIGKMYNPSYALKLETSPQYFKKEARLKIIQSIFQGALWVIIFYNIILFIIVKDKTYAYYSVYILIYSVYYLSYYDFFAEYPQLQIYIGIITHQVTMVFYFLFMSFFVNARRLIPKWIRIIYYWIIIKLFIDLILMIYTYRTLDLLGIEPYLNIIILIDVSVFVLTLYFLFKTKDLLARYFIAGSLCFFLGWGLTSLSFLELITPNFNPNYFSQSGVYLELILFSVGLGYRERKNEQDKRLAEEENARILEEQNALLEQQVWIRTKEIRAKNNDLKDKQQEIEDQHTQLATQHKLITNAHQLLSKAHQSIQASIQSGLRIQKAILPFEERILKALPEHFVFFRPRDIVSGDFYWFEEVDNQQFIMAADCTGHGIPGAFMTMLCIQALNNIIMQRHIHSPGQILNALDDFLPQILKTEETSVRDGMDAAICVINKQQQTLQYAGAMNPLIFVQNNELQVIKGTRCGINGHRKENEIIRFGLHTIDISTPTTFYLFSDGIQDQFGGDKGRKFSSKQLRKTLLEMSQQSILQQKETLSHAIDAWQGSNKQVDDMLLIGAHINSN